MLILNKLPLAPVLGKKIQRWLGADGSTEFMDWLVAREAIATVEAANLLTGSVTDATKLADAQQKAGEAEDYRRLIELINQARLPDFLFERCEIKQPIPINPQTTT